MLTVTTRPAMTPTLRRLLLALLALASASFASAACKCGDACQCGADCACEAEAPSPSADAGHALKGVVQNVMADRQSLLVKHEEIPGVMRAMTMMLRVEPAVLTQIKAGDAITARLHRSDDGVWFLTDVAAQKE